MSSLPALFIFASFGHGKSRVPGEDSDLEKPQTSQQRKADHKYRGSKRVFAIRVATRLAKLETEGTYN